MDPWSGDTKSYLWQPVIASAVIRQTKMEEPQTAVSPLLGPSATHIFWMTGETFIGCGK